MSTPYFAADVQRLLTEFDTYDQHVDVVSIMEWLFTHTKELPSTVKHFERFPKVDHARKRLTPDFTVHFHDGSAIVGEIAKIALHSNSADKLCSQLANYDEITTVQDGSTSTTRPANVDVLLIVANDVGLAAVKEVIVNRMLNPEHSYKPSKPPCIAQYARTGSKYTFQRLQNPENGRLTSGDKPKSLGEFLDNGLNVQAEHFKGVKATRRFINDEVPQLYLATHLWTSTWPSQFGGSREDIAVNPGEIARTLQEQFGTVRARQVKRALELLEAAGLAARGTDDEWTVTRKRLGNRNDKDIHRLIAERAGRQATPMVKAPRRSREAFAEPTLF